MSDERPIRYIDGGSGITMDQVKEIAQVKLQDTNAGSLETCMQSIIGTARSMGVELVE